MAKKAPRNAFFYFMLEFQEKEKRQGKNFSDMRQLSIAADPFWVKMSKEEKEVFERKAKHSKGTAKKYTSQGLDVEIIKKKEEDENKRDLDMKEDIQQTISVAQNCGQLNQEYFYIVHTNDFCFSNPDNRYYLAEIALTRFNLQDGVKDEDVFHAIIKPGPLPLGYSYQARKTSMETHQLTPPQSDDPSNVEDVFMNFLQCLAEGKKTKRDKFPPVYVYEPAMVKMMNIFTNLCIDYGYPEDTIRVYDLYYLFYKLRNACSEDSFPFLSIATLEIEKDLYDYSKNIACEFHEETDAVRFCSRSHVIRSAYTICDACCSYLDIQLIAGQHVPYGSDLSRVVSSRAESALSMQFSDAQPPRNDSRTDNQSNRSAAGSYQTISPVGWNNRPQPRPNGGAGGRSSQMSHGGDAEGYDRRAQYNAAADDDDAVSVSESLAASTVDNLDDYLALGGDVRGGGDGAWQSVPSKHPSKKTHGGAAASAAVDDDLANQVQKMGFRGRGRGVAGAASSGRGSVLKFRYGTHAEAANAARPPTSASTVDNEWANRSAAFPLVPQQQQQQQRPPQTAAAALNNAWSRPESVASSICSTEENFPALGSSGSSGRSSAGRGRGRGRGILRKF